MRFPGCNGIVSYGISEEFLTVKFPADQVLSKHLKTDFLTARISVGKVPDSRLSAAYQ
jgi:hypothetical protein